MANLNWLITGCSSGLGLCIARAALQAGHRVIATSRNPSKTLHLVQEIESQGGIWAALDVTDDKLEERIEGWVRAFGTVDVVVNNAGFAIGGSLEDTPVALIREQMETNFWGPIRLTKALLPHFRAKHSGTIVNITSSEAVASRPGISAYGASKAALESVSEALAGEVAAFGIRVLIVEPGGMRTPFLDGPVTMPPSEAYEGGIVDRVLGAVMEMKGKQALDPVRSAERIVQAVDGSGGDWPEGREGFLRLPLGKEVVGRIEEKVGMWRGTVDGLKAIWGSVDFGS